MVGLESQPGSDPGSKLSATESNSGHLGRTEQRQDALRSTGTFRLGAGRSQVQILSPRSRSSCRSHSTPNRCIGRVRHGSKVGDTVGSRKSRSQSRFRRTCDHPVSWTPGLVGPRASPSASDDCAGGRSDARGVSGQPLCRPLCGRGRSSSRAGRLAPFPGQAEAALRLAARKGSARTSPAAPGEHGTCSQRIPAVFSRRRRCFGGDETPVGALRRAGPREFAAQVTLGLLNEFLEKEPE
jgi:hypothetical protein